MGAASRLIDWAPFNIDALGLVTLVGADEVNLAIGSLCTGLTDFLPLVAGHVIAGDTFRHHMPGFTVFNITDSIRATDVAGWFSRWLLCQHLPYNTATLIVTLTPTPPTHSRPWFAAAALGLAVFLAILLLAVLISDWWGVANAAAVAALTVARGSMVKANRDALAEGAERGAKQSSAVVKTFWNLSDGCRLVVYVPRGILTECLLTTPRPRSPAAYAVYRHVAWVGFLVHAVSLGMAALPCQLLCVGVLAASTVCTAKRVMCEDGVVAGRLHIRRLDRVGGGGSMAATMASLMLSGDEEESMVEWGIMPLWKNQVWWRKYRDCVARNSIKAFDGWKEKESWARYEAPSTTVPAV